MNCKICGALAIPAFSATVLGRHKAAFSRCQDCGYLFADEPAWLAEAYKSPINPEDTGILQRNIRLSRKAAAVIGCFFDKSAALLDYAGGYGIFTRLMRDIGFEMRWHDPYTQNLFARGFEHDGAGRVELLTTFESFEHFTSPIAELEKMLMLSDNILFTTLLLPSPVPAPLDWWYYGFEHGQHVGFYTRRSLEKMAGKFGLNLVTNGLDFHLLTKRRVNPLLFRVMLKLGALGLHGLLLPGLRSRTFADMSGLAGAGRK